MSRSAGTILFCARWSKLKCFLWGVSWVQRKYISSDTVTVIMLSYYFQRTESESGLSLCLLRRPQRLHRGNDLLKAGNIQRSLMEAPRWRTQDLSRPTNAVQPHHEPDGFSELVLHLQYNSELESVAAAGWETSALLVWRSRNTANRLELHRSRRAGSACHDLNLFLTQRRDVLYTVSYGFAFLPLLRTEIKNSITLYAILKE